KEVWKLKDKAFKEVEKIDLKDALKERINKSIHTAKILGFKTKEL
ncbi:MAG: hypothetical protein HQK76_08765, partial [Desulfobacterales bacterium]|nr:hypothetical protein [Desulfobacterales bacterium]